MKPNIDPTLDRLTHHTHSPRGRYAATEETYKELLMRIPAEQRPAIGKRKLQRRSVFTRWSAAASLLLLISIGLAIAGIWQYQHDIPSATHKPSESAQYDSNEEPRTLHYQVTPLADITAELSEIYHTSIQIIHPELYDYGITATFSTDEPLDEILAILSEIGHFEVRETAEGYIIE